MSSSISHEFVLCVCELQSSYVCFKKCLTIFRIPLQNCICSHGRERAPRVWSGRGRIYDTNERSSPAASFGQAHIGTTPQRIWKKIAIFFFYYTHYYYYYLTIYNSIYKNEHTMGAHKSSNNVCAAFPILRALHSRAELLLYRRK